MSSTDLKPYLWMLCGCGWFAAMVLCIAAVKDAIDWQTVAVVRSGLATLFAVTTCLVTRTPLAFPGSPTLWLRSVAGSLSLISTFYALTHLPPSDVLVITNAFPVWVAILSWPVNGERPTLPVWGAVGCAVAGVAVIQLLGTPAADPTVTAEPANWWEAVLAPASAVFASIFTAVAMMGLNRLKNVASMAVVAHFSAVSLIVCVIAFFVFDRSLGNARIGEWPVLLLLLGMGVTATVGQVFLTKAFRGGAATKVSVVGLSQVVMVAAWEAVVNGRQFTLWQLVGAVLVLGPTAYLMVRERRAARKEQEADVVVDPLTDAPSEPMR